jgi:hypothetical protein
MQAGGVVFGGGSGGGILSRGRTVVVLSIMLIGSI